MCTGNSYLDRILENILDIILDIGNQFKHWRIILYNAGMYINVHTKDILYLLKSIFAIIWEENQYQPRSHTLLASHTFIRKPKLILLVKSKPKLNWREMQLKSSLFDSKYSSYITETTKKICTLFKWKSDYLQYNTLGRWFDGSKRLMFQALFFS